MNDMNADTLSAARGMLYVRSHISSLQAVISIVMLLVWPPWPASASTDFELHQHGLRNPCESQM